MPFDAFDELAGSPQITIGARGKRGTRRGHLPWNRLNEFSNYVFPTFGANIGMPGFPDLQAVSMLVEAFQGESDVIVGQSDDTDSDLGNYTLDFDTINIYTRALATIEYETSNSDLGMGGDPTELLSHRWTAAVEQHEVEGRGLVWSKNGVADGEPKSPVYGAIRVPVITHQITWPRVQNPPFSVIRDCIGGCNSSAMSFMTGVIAPETLTLEGVELNRDVLSIGALAWEVTYIFAERRVPLAESDKLGGSPTGDAISVGGWNHFFRDEADPDGKTGFYRLQVKADRAGAGNPLFALKNMNALFVQGP